MSNMSTDEHITTVPLSPDEAASLKEFDSFSVHSLEESTATVIVPDSTADDALSHQLCGTFLALSPVWSQFRLSSDAATTASTLFDAEDEAGIVPSPGSVAGFDFFPDPSELDDFEVVDSPVTDNDHDFYHALCGGEGESEYEADDEKDDAPRTPTILVTEPDHLAAVAHLVPSPPSPSALPLPASPTSETFPSYTLTDEEVDDFLDSLFDRLEIQPNVGGNEAEVFATELPFPVAPELHDRFEPTTPPTTPDFRPNLPILPRLVIPATPAWYYAQFSPDPSDPSPVDLVSLANGRFARPDGLVPPVPKRQKLDLSTPASPAASLSFREQTTLTDTLAGAIAQALAAADADPFASALEDVISSDDDDKDEIAEPLTPPEIDDASTGAETYVRSSLHHGAHILGCSSSSSSSSSRSSSSASSQQHSPAYWSALAKLLTPSSAAASAPAGDEMPHGYHASPARRMLSIAELEALEEAFEEGWNPLGLEATPEGSETGASDDEEDEDLAEGAIMMGLSESEREAVLGVGSLFAPSVTLSDGGSGEGWVEIEEEEEGWMVPSQGLIVDEEDEDDEEEGWSDAWEEESEDEWWNIDVGGSTVGGSESESETDDDEEWWDAESELGDGETTSEADAAGQMREFDMWECEGVLSDAEVRVVAYLLVLRAVAGGLV